MQPPPLRISLRQDRDFGEVFNATFAFIRQNAAVLFKSVLFFVAPVSAVGAVFFGQYISGLFGLMTQLEDEPSVLLALIPPVLLGMAFATLAMVLLQVVVLGAMALYEERGPGQFTPPDVWQRGRPYLGRVLGWTVLFGVALTLSIALNIIPCLGTILWLIGLVYAGTRFSLTSAAYVLDDQPFSDGIRRSWEIVAPAFWQTFGVIAVTGLVAGILGTIFQLPITILVQAKVLLSSDPATALSGFSSPWITVYMVLATIAQQVLYVIPMVGIGFQYGNLSESVTESGLMRRLSDFATGPGTPEEGRG